MKGGARGRAVDKLVQDLLSEIERLRQENYRLRLALALKDWKPAKRHAGRPVKRDQQSKADFFSAIDKLCEHYGFKGRGAIPKLCRKLNADLPLPKRLNSVALKQQIKSIQNRVGEARKPR